MWRWCSLGKDGNTNAYTITCNVFLKCLPLSGVLHKYSDLAAPLPPHSGDLTIEVYVWQPVTWNEHSDIRCSFERRLAIRQEVRTWAQFPFLHQALSLSPLSLLMFSSMDGFQERTSEILCHHPTLKRLKCQALPVMTPRLRLVIWNCCTHILKTTQENVWSTTWPRVTTAPWITPAWR